MRQKDEIELVIRSSQPPCLCEGLFCVVLACALCVFFHAFVCVCVCARVSASPLSPTLCLLTMANAPVCLRGVVSQKKKTTTHPGTARFVGVLWKEDALIREAL